MAEPVLAAVQIDDRRIELRELPRPAEDGVAVEPMLATAPD